MTNIHPTAIVDERAKIGSGVTIAPYAYIEGDVEIGDGSSVGPHACVYDGARIGKNVKIFQSASVANLHIGDNSVIREFVTLHKGTTATRETKIGANCLLMNYVHIAHDCVVGDNVIIANSCQIGGHVEIGDYVIIGGTAAVHQFVKIGKYTMIAGGYRVPVDVPPFVLAANEPLRYTGLNVVGLRRRGFSNERIAALKAAYNALYSSGLNLSQGVEKLKEDFKDDADVGEIIAFIARASRTVLKR